MSKVHYLIEFTISDGKKAEFESKAKGFVAATEANEQTTLEYNWYVDGNKCLLYEAFENSEALLLHLGNVGPALPDLLAIAPITRFEVLGAVSDDARNALATLGVAFFPLLTGFTR